MTVATLLDGVLEATTSDPIAFNQGKDTTFLAVVTGTGAVTGTVVIEGSHDGETYITLDTLAMDGTTTDNDFGTTVGQMWPYMRADCTAITGTGAAITVTIAY